MRNWPSKRVWIIGASRGVGRALALELSASGAEVVASARDQDALQELLVALPGRGDMVPMDVCDPVSVADGIAQVGPVDAVVYLVGQSGQDPIETMQKSFTGAARIIDAILPEMQAQNQGQIVLLGRTGGYRGGRGLSGHAGAAAAMHMAETLWVENADTGVDVQLVTVTDRALNDPEIVPVTAREILEHMGTDQFRRLFPIVATFGGRMSMMLPDWLLRRW